LTGLDPHRRETCVFTKWITIWIYSLKCRKKMVSSLMLLQTQTNWRSLRPILSLTWWTSGGKSSQKLLI
jgi:hypothetical protein